jgi:hypothetical protein
MAHIRDEEPLNICSEKVQDRVSTSRVRSLAKRILGLLNLHQNFTQEHSTNPHARIERLGDGTVVLRMAQPPYLGCRGPHKTLK